MFAPESWVIADIESQEFNQSANLFIDCVEASEVIILDRSFIKKNYELRMARERNLKNLKTEKEGIIILKKKIRNFFIPNSDERKYIYKKLDIDYKKYSRSVDGFILNVSNIEDVKSEKDLTLVEIKTTKAKNITKLPYGAFFGITQNEEDLFKARNNYRLCIVHSITEDYALIDYDEYNSLIQNKRVQYQVNFKSKE